MSEELKIGDFCKLKHVEDYESSYIRENLRGIMMIVSIEKSEFILTHHYAQLLCENGSYDEFVMSELVAI